MFQFSHRLLPFQILPKPVQSTDVEVYGCERGTEEGDLELAVKFGSLFRRMYVKKHKLMQKLNMDLDLDVEVLTQFLPLDLMIVYEGARITSLEVWSYTNNAASEDQEEDEEYQVRFLFS